MRFLGAALLGVMLSLVLYELWDFDTRWFVTFLVGISAVAISMCLVRIFSDFLLVSTLFCLPLVTFSKWFAYEDIYAGALGIGVVDFLICGLYMSWFYRVFVTRVEPPPRFTRLDGLIVWFTLAHLLAAFGSQNPGYGLSATEFLVKYVLFYFYLSRHFGEHHLPWLLGAFAFTVLVDASLGSYQFATGSLVGIGLDRGAGGSQLDAQYHVPGTGSYHRATGTSYDSHTLGHLMAMIVPFPLVLCVIPGVRPALKLGCLAVSGAAFLTILFTLSRAAWFSCAIGLAVGGVLIIVLWREREVIIALAAAVVLAALVAPFIAGVAYDRLANAPTDVLTYRYWQYAVGWHVFTLYPLFGVGPGNWLQALRRYDFAGLELISLHNALLYIAVEVGTVGLLAYLGTMANVMLRLFALARRRRDIVGRLALAPLVSMVITLLDGLTEPAFREPNAFLMFWLLVSLSVALPRLPLGAGAILMTPLRPAGPTPASGPTPGILAGGAAGWNGK
jgi:hypothetical protein